MFPMDQSKSTTSTPILKFRDGIAVREFHEDDVSDSVQCLNEPEVRTFLRNRIPSPYTESDFKWWIDRCADQTNWIPTGPFEPDPQDSTIHRLPSHYAIVKDDRLIGAIGLEMKSDVYCRTGELGYWIARPQWGKGIMGSVAPAFVKWAFATFGILYRIEAEIFSGNDASRAVLKKSGMKFEGRHEGSIWKNGQILDGDFWGIVRTEKDDAQ
ncbi:MAG: hypothetical protein GOMPHAMPRED_003617 [Gomphillus americanus]|uniref:N-acetyltransferase domain-containing protein n=1 Tax=Gomphillus americanus TaxID=1940652 RepID=A0A8H3FFQ2_9LECA|nr:MAG: hypothetical protein GOMPHAMPRED_003617 [Gomphillus americanus]